MSAINALHRLTERYSAAGKTLQLRHLSPDCRRLLESASALIRVDMQEDPVYAVATDRGADIR